MYTPGEANPYPGLITAGNWAGMTSTSYGLQAPNSEAESIYASPSPNSPPGGIIFFTSNFAGWPSGFATPGGENTQMTYFFHEQDLVANHNPATDHKIEGPGLPADYQKINTTCQPQQPQQIPLVDAPLTGGLTPP